MYRCLYQAIHVHVGKYTCTCMFMASSIEQIQVHCILDQDLKLYSTISLQERLIQQSESYHYYFPTGIYIYMFVSLV